MRKFAFLAFVSISARFLQSDYKKKYGLKLLLRIFISFICFRYTQFVFLFIRSKRFRVTQFCGQTPSRGNYINQNYYIIKTKTENVQGMQQSRNITHPSNQGDRKTTKTRNLSKEIIPKADADLIDINKMNCNRRSRKQ